MSARLWCLVFCGFLLAASAPGQEKRLVLDRDGSTIETTTARIKLEMSASISVIPDSDRAVILGFPLGTTRSGQLSAPRTNPHLRS